MTDFSTWTDEQINEAIAIKQGWVIDEYLIGDTRVREGKSSQGKVCVCPDELPDYTHDWQLCGELLKDMKVADVILLYCPGANKWACDWNHWVQGSYETESEQADTSQRALCQAWLAWKDG